MGRTEETRVRAGKRDGLCDEVSPIYIDQYDEIARWSVLAFPRLPDVSSRL